MVIFTPPRDPVRGKHLQRRMREEIDGIMMMIIPFLKPYQSELMMLAISNGWNGGETHTPLKRCSGPSNENEKKLIQFVIFFCAFIVKPQKFLSKKRLGVMK